MSTGLKIKMLRIKKNLSQRELAEKLGINKSMVSYWETDKYSPTSGHLLKLSHIFNVTPNFLMGFDSADHRGTTPKRESTECEACKLKDEEIEHLKRIIQQKDEIIRHREELYDSVSKMYQEMKRFNSNKPEH